MFTHDPNIDHKEEKHLIKEIVSAIKKVSMSSDRTRCVVSWNYNHKSDLYIKNLLPQFDKCIEVTSLEGKHSSLTLGLRIHNGRSSSHCKNRDGTIHCLLQSNDLYFVPQK